MPACASVHVEGLFGLEGGRVGDGKFVDSAVVNSGIGIVWEDGPWPKTEARNQ